MFWEVDPLLSSIVMRTRRLVSRMKGAEGGATTVGDDETTVPVCGVLLALVIFSVSRKVEVGSSFSNKQCASWYG